MNLDSEFVIFHRATKLACVVPVKYNCCINSCILYTAQYACLPTCPYCNEARLKPNGKPRRQFCYFPLIPRLQGFFQSVEQIQLMEYRFNFESRPNNVSDIFDGVHYQKRLRERVVVDGEELGHRYFSDHRNVALALCTDGYLLYK